MGVTPHQLAHQVIDNAIKIEMTILTTDLGIKDDLKQQVAQLVFQVTIVTSLDGIRHLVGLFDGVRHNGAVGLFRIPRAAGFRVP